ncbi:MAG: DotU family type IV/VI secretion system protein [Syntrophaceae bacterium]
MESAAENIRGLPPPPYLHCPVRLSDAFMEIIAYTGDLLEKFKTGNIGCEEVSRDYAELISLAEDLVQLRGFSPAQWRDSLFPVCALIDELLMCSAWQQKEEWQKYQLQLAFFDTTNAGEEFFRRLAALRAECPEGEGGNDSVREIYAFCLAMGFKGRYYGPQDSGRLRDIRDANIRAVTGMIGPSVADDSGELFPGAYPLETNYRKKKGWNRKFNFLSVTIFLLPLAVFAAMFILYRNILGTLVDNFFK